MSWLPDGFEHPLREDLPTGHHLRPIRAEDADIDYPAVMGSRERLWAKYGEAWGWAAETLSFDSDREDLERHTWVCTTSPGPNCASSAAQRTTQSSYYDGGQLHTRLKPGKILETRTYNTREELTRLKRAKVDDNGGELDVLKNQAYGYDDNGNRWRDERGLHLFNARSQLIRWKRTNDKLVHYTLNGAGAITKRVEADANDQTELSVEFCFDADRIERLRTPSCSASNGQDVARYRYDPRGFSNLDRIDTLTATGQTDKVTSYGYDAFGRMIRSEGPLTGPQDAQDNGSYIYDALDRRDVKSLDTKTLDHSYIGLTEALSRQDGTGGQVKRYDYDSTLSRLGQTTKQDTAASEQYRGYGTDANGTVEALEKPDGTVANDEKYSYSPYGEQETAEASLSPQAQDNPFRFQGFYYDSEVSTYDMQARPYRPDLGRFLTQDRYEDALGDLALQSDPLTNDRYTFVAGNPVNNIEFDGHRLDLSPGQTPPGQKRVSGGGGASGQAITEANRRFAISGKTAIDREPGTTTAAKTAYALAQAECETRTGIRRCDLGINPNQVAMTSIVRNPPTSAGDIYSTVSGAVCGGADASIARPEVCWGLRKLSTDKAQFDRARQATGEATTIATAVAVPYGLAAGGRALLTTGATRTAAGAGDDIAAIGLRPTRAASRAAKAADEAADLARAGRRGKQQRLRELADDPNAPSWVRGWIRQDLNEIARGQRKRIRVPPGYELAHRYGREARRGFGYEFSDLKDILMHRSQHRIERELGR